MRSSAGVRLVTWLLASFVSIVPVTAGLITPQRTAVPRLTLVEDVRIDATKDRFAQTGAMTIAPDGTVIFAPGPYANGQIIAMDSTAHTKLWATMVGFSRDTDIRWVNRFGWTGPTLWISDRGFGQIALLDRAGKVTKSIEIPAFIRPTVADRRRYPVFSAADVFARYADGSLLVRPFREHRLIDTPEFDTSSTELLRVTEEGTILRSIAKLPLEDLQPVRVDRGSTDLVYPLQNRTYFGVSQDGMRIVLVRANVAGKDSGTIGVTSLNERGDTTFTRRYPFTAQPMTQRTRDSLLRRYGNPEQRADVERRIPPVLPPVGGLVIGRDRTVWIELRPAPGDTAARPILVIDARGDVVGTFDLPRRSYVVNGDRGHVWVTEKKGLVVTSLARFRLVAR